MTLREPLQFCPLHFEKVWGGRRLEAYQSAPLDTDGPVGEIWTVVDRDDGRSSVIASGTFKGRTLRGLMLSEREDLLGSASAAPGGHFPLVIKLLDAHHDLSVQVHPDERAAERIGGESQAKTEAWYVLSAEPGSQFYLGLKPDVDAATFAANAPSPNVLDLLQTFDARPGQFYFVPPGTVHAIGAGISLVEVQTNSDTTYRLFDWERLGLDGKPRELHTDVALQAIDYEQDPVGPSEGNFDDADEINPHATLVDCEAFGIDLFAIASPLDRDTDGKAVLYAVVEGTGRITVSDLEGEWELRPGDTWLVPAAAREHRLESDGELRVLLISTKA